MCQHLFMGRFTDEKSKSQKGQSVDKFCRKCRALIENIIFDFIGCGVNQTAHHYLTLFLKTMWRLLWYIFLFLTEHNPSFALLLICSYFFTQSELWCSYNVYSYKKKSVNREKGREITTFCSIMSFQYFCIGSCNNNAVLAGFNLWVMKIK